MPEGAIGIGFRVERQGRAVLRVALAVGACGVGFLDAPVSGGQAGAENGQLTVMVGGDADVFDRARPVIDCYARAVRLMGPAGAGSLAQVVNTAIGNKGRFDAMDAFFKGVGQGYSAGVWEDTPEDRPEFRERMKKRAAEQMKKKQKLEK